MALGRDRQQKETHEDKVIEINAKMQGTLSFKDPVNLKINGQFEGTMETRGTLTIGETALVEAHISGENIIIAGKVKGDIIAKKTLVLAPTAILSGNLLTPQLTIAQGAIFNGKCQMLDEYLDTNELAKYLELETPAVVELANSGKIPGIREGNNWKFERAKIDEWAGSTRIKQN